MFTIRQAASTDARLIAEISRETFEETFARHNTVEDMHKFMTEQFSMELLMGQVGAEGNLFLLAEQDGKAAGYVFLKTGTEENHHDKKSIEISRIYVRSEFIGQGIGKQLMEAALQTAAQLSCDIIWLGVWEHNHHAIRFYQAFGFQKFSEHDFVLGDDVQRDWLMRKQLAINN